MDQQQIKREVTWYRDEITARQRDLREVLESARRLEDTIRDNQRKLDQFTEDLVRSTEGDR